MLCMQFHLPNRKAVVERHACTNVPGITSHCNKPKIYGFSTSVDTVILPTAGPAAIFHSKRDNLNFGYLYQLSFYLMSREDRYVTYD